MCWDAFLCVARALSRALSDIFFFFCSVCGSDIFVTLCGLLLFVRVCARVHVQVAANTGLGLETLGKHNEMLDTLKV